MSVAFAAVFAVAVPAWLLPAFFPVPTVRSTTPSQVSHTVRSSMWLTRDGVTRHCPVQLTRNSETLRQAWLTVVDARADSFARVHGIVHSPCLLTCA